VLVNGACDVLYDQCLRSNGGLWYENLDKWLAVLKWIDEQTRMRLGMQGKRFARLNYSWEQVETLYLNLIGTVGQKKIRVGS
jgi:hypothetical protein